MTQWYGNKLGLTYVCKVPDYCIGQKAIIIMSEMSMKVLMLSSLLQQI